MSRRPAGPGLALLLILILLLGGMTVYFLPLSPSITVTFNIGHTSEYPQHPTINIMTWFYSKVTFASSVSISKGEIQISSGGSAGQAIYALSITVAHNNQTLSGPTLVCPRKDFRLWVLFRI